MLIVWFAIHVAIYKVYIFVNTAFVTCFLISLILVAAHQSFFAELPLSQPIQWDNQSQVWATAHQQR